MQCAFHHTFTTHASLTHIPHTYFTHISGTHKHPTHAHAGEPALVSAAAQLLTTVLSHNAAALSQLYLSGAFLFGLAYCGSNLTELAQLFKVAHLAQGFR